MRAKKIKRKLFIFVDLGHAIFYATKSKFLISKLITQYIIICALKNVPSKPFSHNFLSLHFWETQIQRFTFQFPKWTELGFSKKI